MRAFGTLFVKGRVASVEIFGVEMVLRYADTLAETLIMDDLALSQELDRIAYVGVVGEAENVVIGRASLLLC